MKCWVQFNADRRNLRAGAKRRAGLTRAEVLVIVAVLAVGLAALSPLLVPKAKRNKQEADMALCKENLRRIGVSLREYAQDNGGMFPFSTTFENPHSDILKSIAAYVPDPKLFYCPAETRPDFSYTPENFKAGVIGYYYFSAATPPGHGGLSDFLQAESLWPRQLNTALDPKTWVMSDIWVSGAPTSHPSTRRGVNYLMLDGTVDFVAASPHQAFQ